MEAKKATVLIVDDSAPLRGAMTRHLEERGYHVVAYASGEEAVAYACTSSEPLAYAFIDYVLHPGFTKQGEQPPLNGIEATRQLMEIDPNICIVVFSGQSDISATGRRKAREAGARRYVYKKGAAIASLVDDLIDEFAELRELRAVAEEIRQQRERIALILRESPVGTLLLDREYFPWFASHDWRQIEEKIDPVTHPLQGLADFLVAHPMLPEQNDFRRELVDVALRGSEKDALTFCEVRPGKLKYLHVWARPIRNEHQKVIACSLSMIDQTASDVIRQMPLEHRLWLIAKAIQRAGYDRVRLYRASANEDRIVGMTEVGGNLSISDFQGFEVWCDRANYLQKAIQERRPRFWRLQDASINVRTELRLTSDFIVFPLIVQGLFRGLLAVDRNKSHEQRPLSEADITPLGPYAEEARQAFYEAKQNETGPPEDFDELRHPDLADVWARIEQCRDAKDAMRVILQIVQERMQCHAGHIRVIQNNQAVMVASFGQFPKHLRKSLPLDGEFWSVRPMHTGHPLVVQDLAEVPKTLLKEQDEWLPETQEAFSHTQALAIFPLIFTGIVGSLTVHALYRGHFTRERRATLLALAHIAAVAWIDMRRVQFGQTMVRREVVFATVHNLRQPTTALRGTFDLLLEKYAEGTLTLEEAVAKVRRASRYLRRSEEIITSISRSLEPLKLRLCKVGLLELVEPIVQGFREAGQRLSIALEIPPALTVYVDDEILRQVFEELLSNAVRATSGEGMIRIHATTASSPEDGIQVIVEDNGPGVAPDLINVLFEPFTTNFAKGTGLGLAFVKRVIEEHRGNLWHEPVVPYSERRGARFVFTLPTQHEGPSDYGT